MPDISILNRQLAFRGAYRRSTTKASNLYKEKSTGEAGEMKSIKSISSESIKKTIEQDNLIEKSLTKKEELDKIISDTKKS